jgi:hypothetical protein
MYVPAVAHTPYGYTFKKQDSVNPVMAALTAVLDLSQE